MSRTYYPDGVDYSKQFWCPKVCVKFLSVYKKKFGLILLLLKC